MSREETPSTRPYLIRALHEWCSDHGFSPYLAVQVDESVQVPREFVRNGEIVLNVSFDATSNLLLGNEFIEFKARFGGVPRDVLIPVDHVVAIYAKENGQGMAFPAPQPSRTTETVDADLDADQGDDGSGKGLQLVTPGVDAKGNSEGDSGGPGGGSPGPGAGRPSLKRVK